VSKLTRTALVFATVILAAAGLTGCGSSSPHAPTASAAFLVLVDRERAPVIVNAGEPASYAYMLSTLLTFSVDADSAATIRGHQIGRAVLVSDVARRHWVALGRPALPTGENWAQPVAAGTFSLLGVGSIPLTVARARALGGSTSHIRAVLTTDAAPPGNKVTPYDELQAYAHVLAWAPLSLATRNAVLWLMLHTSGIRLCAAGAHGGSPAEVEVCASNMPLSTSVSVVGRGTLVIITTYLQERSASYPGFRIGQVVQSDLLTVRRSA
jgi:hypothetical protein